MMTLSGLISNLVYTEINYISLFSFTEFCVGFLVSSCLIMLLLQRDSEVCHLFLFYHFIYISSRYYS